MTKEQEQRLIEALSEYYRDNEWGTYIDKLPEDNILPLGVEDYSCRYHEFDDFHVLNLYFDLDKMSYLNYIDGKLERIDEPIDIETLIKNLEDTNTGCLASGIYDLCDDLYGDVYNEK